MTRRHSAGGDPTIRSAIADLRREFYETFPTSRLAALIDDVEAGCPLELSTETLFQALHRARHPRWSDFTFASDRDGTRRWLLDADNVLHETTEEQEGTRS